MKRILVAFLLIILLTGQGIGPTGSVGPFGGGGTGTSPSIVTTASGTGTSSATSATVNLPSGIVSGNLILIFGVVTNGAAGTPTATGYTCAKATTGGSGDLIWCYRTADGTEGTTIGTAWTTSSKSNWVSMRISGQSANNPEVSTAVTAGVATTTPDGGNAVTPSWGNFADLFISVIGVPQNTAPTFTTAPTNYTTSVTIGTSTFGGVGTAYRQLTGTTDDPGTWTTSSANWTGLTIAIKGI